MERDSSPDPARRAAPGNPRHIRKPLSGKPSTRQESFPGRSGAFRACAHTRPALHTERHGRRAPLPAGSHPSARRRYDSGASTELPLASACSDWNALPGKRCFAVSRRDHPLHAQLPMPPAMPEPASTRCLARPPSSHRLAGPTDMPVHSTARAIRQATDVIDRPELCLHDPAACTIRLRRPAKHAEPITPGPDGSARHDPAVPMARPKIRPKMRPDTWSGRRGSQWLASGSIRRPSHPGGNSLGHKSL